MTSITFSKIFQGTSGNKILDEFSEEALKLFQDDWRTDYTSYHSFDQSNLDNNLKNIRLNQKISTSCHIQGTFGKWWSSTSSSWSSISLGASSWTRVYVSPLSTNANTTTWPSYDLAWRMSEFRKLAIIMVEHLRGFHSNFPNAGIYPENHPWADIELIEQVREGCRRRQCGDEVEQTRWD